MPKKMPKKVEQKQSDKNQQHTDKCNKANFGFKHCELKN